MTLSAGEIQYAESSYEYVKRGYYTEILDKVPDVRKCVKVLDIGVGPGGWLLSLAQTLGDNAHFVGGDISTDWLNLAGERLAAAGVKSFELMTLDAQALPLADGSFDFVVSSLVLPYLKDDEKACLEMARVLRPGGKGLLLFHTPEYYIKRLLTKKLKIKFFSFLSLVSSVAYSVMGKKLYKSTFQTFSRLESIFVADGCSFAYKSVKKSGIGILCFVKG